MLLVNGPSVNDAIIDLLTTNSVYAVVNFFALSKYYQRLKPRYYILSDGAFCCELSFNTMIADLAKKRGRFIQRIAMMTRKTRQSFSIRMFILNLPYPLFICRPIKAWAPSRASAPENAGIHSPLSPGLDAKAAVMIPILS